MNSDCFLERRSISVRRVKEKIVVGIHSGITMESQSSNDRSSNYSVRDRDDNDSVNSQPSNYAQSLVGPQALKEVCWEGGECNGAWSFLLRAIHLSFHRSCSDEYSGASPSVQSSSRRLFDVVDDDKLFSYSTIYSHCLKLGHFLTTTSGIALDVEDRIAVLLPNCVEV